ncbi:phage terminase large subunit [Adlercreutzia sp. ZJ242]|uniref:phage terminase large subunit n=1 Tax=Adlercreutzia sp. ZJ242 TaxID=2709409 RepID=UPI0013EC3644|nr:phage terminase large subunit [Adlercreutzia sp. ZJ242]
MNNQLLLDAITAKALGEASAEPFEDALSVLPSFLEENPVAEMAYARYIRELASDKVVACGADVAEAERIMRCIEGILKLNARADLDSYMLFMEWRREPDKRFWLPRRHVLYPVCEGFQDLADDRLDILIVSLPPRVGKSTTGVFAETWQMGREPLSANVMSGHSDKLTKGFHMEALSIISDDETYRFAEVFPDSPLVDKSMADETIHLKRKGRFPSLTCRSVDGTLTGAVEVGRKGWLYCDDLVSDREEALSAERMDKLYAAYLNQLRDRMLDGAKEVHVGTRWVPNDVIGRVIDKNEGNRRCRVIIIPALDESGETSFDYLYGLGFSTKYYEDMRDSLEEAGEGDSWDAKYMGAPRFIGGLMFPKAELNYYDELPDEEPDGIIAVCDTKDRGADYAVQPIGYIYGTRHYIEHFTCDNGLPEVVEPRLAGALARHGVGKACYESNSAGGRVADSVAEKCRELGHVIDMRKKFSTENKETRILVDSEWIKRRCYFKREPDDEDYRRAMAQLTSYTTEGKNKHDDVPDAMSMYKRFVTLLIPATVEAMRRPF